jgi:hypothetical protein
MKPTTKTALFALALCATLTITATLPGHTDAAVNRLSPQAQRSFRSVFPSMMTCASDGQTVSGDISYAIASLRAGSTDLGSLCADVGQMRDDCLFATYRINSLRFTAGQPLARRVKGELRAAFADYAEGAGDIARAADYLEAGYYSSATSALRDGTSAFQAGTSHLHVASGYISFR